MHDTPRLRYRILGSLSVEDAGRPVTINGRKQRALLALLLLRANTIVSRDQLVAGLWGDEPPETARNTVQVFVADLRRALRAVDLDPIVTKAPGYSIAVVQERFVVAADVELQQRLGQETGRWTVRAAELRLEGGLGFTAGLDEYSTTVVTGLDPARPLGATLSETAGALDVDEAEFAAAGAALIRQLLELGFVVPAAAEP